MNTVATERTRLYIGGDWHKPRDPAMTEIISPATEQTFGAAPTGCPADVDAAVAAARLALQTGPWAGSDGAERAAWMRALGNELAARGEHTAALVSGENGMPITLARNAEGQGPAATLRYYADLAERTPPEERRPAAQPGRVLSRRELLLRAWSSGGFAEHTVDAAVGRLRAALGEFAWLVSTVNKRGYRLEADR